MNKKSIKDSQSNEHIPKTVIARGVASSGRRRLLGSLVGAPIVALAARPALAQPCTVSGTQSAFFASHHPEPCTAGLSAGFYKENWRSWPAQYDCGQPTSGSGSGGRGPGGGHGGRKNVSTYSVNTASATGAGSISNSSPNSASQGNSLFTGGTTFEEAFGSAPRSFGSYYDGEPLTLMNALRVYPGSPEFHWIAALLNSVSIQGYPYSSGDVINMWNNPQIAGQGVTYADIADFFASYLES